MANTYRITMTSKGQVTLPVEIRRDLGLAQYDQMTVSVVDGKILLEPDELTLEDVIGSLKSPPGFDPGDFSEVIEKAWEEVAADRIRRMNEQ